MLISRHVGGVGPVDFLGGSMGHVPIARLSAGRLIQIALAVYLLPALAVVLCVGCLGMVIESCGRLLLARPPASPD